jgi:hypothetical protein
LEVLTSKGQTTPGNLYGKILRRGIENARYLYDSLCAERFKKIVQLFPESKPQSNVLCFRIVPDDKDAQQDEVFLSSLNHAAVMILNYAGIVEAYKVKRAEREFMVSYCARVPENDTRMAEGRNAGALRVVPVNPFIRSDDGASSRILDEFLDTLYRELEENAKSPLYLRRYALGGKENREELKSLKPEALVSYIMKKEKAPHTL